MKTLVKTFVVALSLGVLSSVASFAEGKPGSRPATVAAYKAGIYTSVDGKLNIGLDKEKGGPVDVMLKGTDGKIYYSQHLGKNEKIYRSRLNMSELPDGVYVVEITNGVETTKHQVTLSTKQQEAPARLVAIN
ncbi:hypothetical protein GCM10028818_44760 [Spirosoma horti]